MKVKEAMHKGVEWVGPDTPVIELAKLMRKHDVGAIPIGENDQLIAGTRYSVHRANRSGLFFHQVVNASAKYDIVDCWYPPNLSVIF